MSTTFLCTDTLIIIAAGLVYGWEGALYSRLWRFSLPGWLLTTCWRDPASFAPP